MLYGAAMCHTNLLVSWHMAVAMDSTLGSTAIIRLYKDIAGLPTTNQHL